MVKIEYPRIAADRGPGFWLRFSNLWAARHSFLRKDTSLQWRQRFWLHQDGMELSEPFQKLHRRGYGQDFSFLILGDTGEGGKSQFALVPLIRALKPDFLIINGDVAYPAGSNSDYLHGFFRPYRKIGIPIWAVPGNHEYYSKHGGREFYENFCTTKYVWRWDGYGIPFVKQPGTFWELKDPAPAPLVVIGIDTLMKGDLDGVRDKNGKDVYQHRWLEWRLKKAEQEKRGAIVLFHIPKLVCGKVEKNVFLTDLHEILARYQCVKLIVAAHYHNFQLYDPATFNRFVGQLTSNVATATPHYMVSGAGGAFLHNTTTFAATFRARTSYPSDVQWRQYAAQGRAITTRLGLIGLENNPVGWAVARWEDSVKAHGDVGNYMSMLQVEVKQAGRGFTTIVTPIFLDDVAQLFRNQPALAKIRIDDPTIKPDPSEVQLCRRTDLQVIF